MKAISSSSTLVDRIKEACQQEHGIDYCEVSFLVANALKEHGVLQHALELLASLKTQNPSGDRLCDIFYEIAAIKVNLGVHALEDIAAARKLVNGIPERTKDLDELEIGHHTNFSTAIKGIIGCVKITSRSSPKFEV